MRTLAILCDAYMDSSKYSFLSFDIKEDEAYLLDSSDVIVYVDTDWLEQPDFLKWLETDDEWRRVRNNEYLEHEELAEERLTWKMKRYFYFSGINDKNHPYWAKNIKEKGTPFKMPKFEKNVKRTLFKNVKCSKLKNILSDGILPFNKVPYQGHWTNGRRASNSKDVVYLFDPKTEQNTFAEYYGVALLEVEVDNAIVQAQYFDSIHRDLYTEYITDEVRPEQIKKIYIPKFLEEEFIACMTEGHYDKSLFEKLLEKVIFCECDITFEGWSYVDNDSVQLETTEELLNIYSRALVPRLADGTLKYYLAEDSMDLFYEVNLNEAYKNIKRLHPNVKKYDLS